MVLQDVVQRFQSEDERYTIITRSFGKEFRNHGHRGFERAVVNRLRCDGLNDCSQIPRVDDLAVQSLDIFSTDIQERTMLSSLMIGFSDASGGPDMLGTAKFCRLKFCLVETHQAGGDGFGRRLAGDLCLLIDFKHRGF